MIRKRVNKRSVRRKVKSLRYKRRLHRRKNTTRKYDKKVSRKTYKINRRKKTKSKRKKNRKKIIGGYISKLKSYFDSEKGTWIDIFEAALPHRAYYEFNGVEQKRVYSQVGGDSIPTYDAFRKTYAVMAKYFANRPFDEDTAVVKNFGDDSGSRKDSLIDLFNQAADKIVESIGTGIQQSFGSHILKVWIKEDVRVVMMGDIHGGFQGLWQNIQILIRKGLLTNINDKLMINDDVLLVFCGDVIDRGDFSIECFSLLLKLIIENNTPETIKIIYIRGNHEDKETMEEYGFFADMYDYGGNKPKTSRNRPGLVPGFTALEDVDITDNSGNTMGKQVKTGETVEFVYPERAIDGEDPSFELRDPDADPDAGWYSRDRDPPRYARLKKGNNVLWIKRSDDGKKSLYDDYGGARKLFKSHASEVQEELVKVVNLLPSAAVLELSNKRIFACHGCLPPLKYDDKSLLPEPVKKSINPGEQDATGEQVATGDPDATGEQVATKTSLTIGPVSYKLSISIDITLSDRFMWSDLDCNTNRKTRVSGRGPKNGTECIVVGINDLYTCMAALKIDFLIRGHQDSYENTVIGYPLKTRLVDEDDPIFPKWKSAMIADYLIPEWPERTREAFEGVVIRRSLKPSSGVEGTNGIHGISIQRLYKPGVSMSYNSAIGCIALPATGDRAWLIGLEDAVLQPNHTLVDSINSSFRLGPKVLTISTNTGAGRAFVATSFIVINNVCKFPTETPQLMDERDYDTFNKSYVLNLNSFNCREHRTAEEDNSTEYKVEFKDANRKERYFWVRWSKMVDLSEKLEKYCSDVAERLKKIQEDKEPELELDAVKFPTGLRYLKKSKEMIEGTSDRAKKAVDKYTSKIADLKKLSTPMKAHLGAYTYKGRQEDLKEWWNQFHSPGLWSDWKYVPEMNGMPDFLVAFVLNAEEGEKIKKEANVRSELLELYNSEEYKSDRLKHGMPSDKAGRVDSVIASYRRKHSGGIEGLLASEKKVAAWLHDNPKRKPEQSSQ